MLDPHMYLAHILNPMTLDEYLSTTGTLEAAFGVRIGLSQSQVNRLRRGESWPPRDVMERIRTATDQQVTPNDWLPSRPSEPQPEAAA